MDGGHLPTAKMFRAAFTSRSCVSPHARHTHVLTPSPFTPAGPVRAPHDDQVRLVYLSPTIDTHLPACWPLYCSCVLSMPQPASSTDFAIRVFTSFRLLTSPMTIFWYSLTIFVENRCKASFRRRAAVRCRRLA